MQSLGLMSLPVALIDASDRLRAVDEGHAEWLAQNIADVGKLRSPIEVRRGDECGDGRWLLIAGAHRLRAVQILGWSEVDAFVFEATPDEARLAEIDENLVRHELNPLDRAIFLAERKVVYERLYPDTARGVAGARAMHKNYATESDSVASFSADASAKCGVTDRVIRNAVFIATNIPADVRARLVGSRLAQKQNELLALAKLPADLQRKMLPSLLGTLMTVEEARQAATGGRSIPQTADDADFAKLVAQWGRSSLRARKQFRDWLAVQSGE